MTYPDARSFVRQRPGRFHLEIDLEELGRVLANEPLPDAARARIVGPHDLHVLDRLRRRHGVTSDGAIPSDCFLMATGDAPHRAMTKLGGVPCLPASMPWPTRRGTVGDFYAQLNFVDSKDIVPRVPADVLLVFRFHDLDCSSWDPDLYEFVWVDPGEKALIGPGDVRSSANGSRDPWPAMHGYRVRSYDLPHRIGGLEHAEAEARNLRSAVATKIGGEASDCQSARGPEVPPDWSFLGQVAAVWPATDVPYPVVDRSAPVSSFSDPDHSKLRSGPGDGVTCLYLDPRGAVRVRFSCA